MIYVIISLLVVFVILIIINVRIIPQSQAAVIERIGAYCKRIGQIETDKKCIIADSTAFIFEMSQQNEKSSN